MPRPLSPVPYVDEVAGQAAGNQEQGIDADVVAVTRIARSQPLGGDGNAAQAIFVERPGRGCFAAALLDFDEGEDVPAASDEIDFAARDPSAARKDPPAVQAQPPGGDSLGPAPARFGLTAVQPPPPSSSARE